MIKRIIRKMILGYKASSTDYINKIKSGGAVVGENVIIFSPNKTNIDLLNLHLLTIGSNVAMTGPVTILTHDYSVFVCNNLNEGHLLGKQKRVTIGNNVFIGWGATILAGTEIGNNVVIGASAVVSGKISSNSVYAGNPARKIMTIEEYIDKIQKKQLEDAVSIFESYYLRMQKIPDESLFHEYFFLFTNTAKKLNPLFTKKMQESDEEKCIKYLEQNKSPFLNYKEFCEYCINEINLKG